MSTQRSTIDHLHDQLSELHDIRSRPMFGEYGIYLGDKIFALVCNDELFIKPTNAGREHLGTPDEAPPYPGAKNYYRISADQWENREWLTSLIIATTNELPAPKPKRPSKPRQPTAM